MGVRVTVISGVAELAGPIVMFWEAHGCGGRMVDHVMASISPSI